MWALKASGRHRARTYEKPCCRVTRRNGVIDAADALGGRPGIFGSASATSPPLCVKCASDANVSCPRTVRSLASVEGH